ncbi:hypothetical protein [Amycolatopsis sp. NPDC051903]|uniref:hypothetical protein n=1 Tax=Amycolatopsis sp. NPDC051903 TaxID=3363936 RepID=UPI00379BD6F1
MAVAAIGERLGRRGTGTERHPAILTDPAQGLTPNARFIRAELDTVVFVRNRHARAGAPITAEEALAGGLVDASPLPEGLTRLR